VVLDVGAREQQVRLPGGVRGLVHEQRVDAPGRPAAGLAGVRDGRGDGDVGRAEAHAEQVYFH